MAAGFPHSELRRQQDREAQGRSLSTLYNLTLELTSRGFCHILLIRNKSRDPAHTLRGEITNGGDYQETKIIGAIFRSCPTDITYAKLKLHLPDAQDKVSLKLSLLSFHF